MNVTRLVGMALLIVGIIVSAIGWGLSYQLGLYLGIVLIVVSFVIYAIGEFKEMKPR